MDFLKSAVASAISKGPPFPYNFGDEVDLDQSLWTLFNGTRRDDGSQCSIFTFEVSSDRSRLQLARNAVKKLRTLRHPGVIKVLDTVETDSYIYIATERLVPLRWHVKRKSLSPETIKWGLQSLAQTIKFINDDATSVHGALKVGTVYTSESGEWKLGGFEVLSSMKDDEAIIYNFGSLVPDSSRYTAPELQGGWNAIKKNPISAVDSYNYGVLIYEVFNGNWPGGDQAGQTKDIPPSMHTGYKRLCNANPKARLSVAHFLEQGARSGGFFATPLIQLSKDVESLGMKSDNERDHFLNDLEKLSDDFPEDYFKIKVLPELIKSVEFGNGGPKVLGAIVKIGGRLSDDEFESKITPVVIRLFTSPDRGIRVCLLDNLPHMIDRFPQKVVNDRIFPQMVTGFTDAAPIVREQTVKAVLTIIEKLSDRTINGELLKHLAKTSNDEQPGIRTNTTICLGKISKNLRVSTRGKVLIAAFTRSLRDPFVHARAAALLALSATVDVFNEDDCANRILPGICPSLVDKEKLVRDQAKKCLNLYLEKVRKYAAQMADTVLPPSNILGAPTAQPPRMATPQPNETASWTGWAISSFTNKVSSAVGEISSNGATSDSNPVQPSSEPALETLGRPIAGITLSLPHTDAASPSARSMRQFSAGSLQNSSSLATNTLDVDNDDFDDWGALDDDDAFEETLQPTSSILSGSSKAKAKPTPAPQATSYDDGGEPDFAGWLAAQAKPATKTLPKGLGKVATKTTLPERPVQRRMATTGSTGTGPGVRSVAVTAKKPAAVKKLDLAPKDDDDEDGWGDGW